MDIRPEIGVPNPSWLDEPDLFRGLKDYSNDKHSALYGWNPEDYKDELENRKEVAEEELEHGWNEDYTDFQHGRFRPKTQAEIDLDKDDVERWLDLNNRMAWDDPHSPIQRMNQPMGTYMKIGWKDDDGNYTASDSLKNALNYSNGGSFKDALLAMDPQQKQDWLNNNYGGRGLGYMGQNAYPSIPMAKRKQLVQQNAKPALIRQLARMNRPKVAPYGAGLFQFGKLPWQ